jgi:valyl-tRNA synthetase
MSGRLAVWVPGVDHAGIATQSVCEKSLWHKHKLTRHDLGREKFVKKCFEWKNEYGARIERQEKMMGISTDWERNVFTMDETRCVAVKEAFYRLFHKGLIYRSDRLVNWSC